MRIGRNKDFPLAPSTFVKLVVHSDTSEVLYCSVYTECTRFNLAAPLNKDRRGNRFCHMCSSTCMHLTLACPGSPILPQRAQRGPFPLWHTQSLKALVCVCSLITANQGKHILQGGMTSIYTAVCKLFQICQNKDYKAEI